MAAREEAITALAESMEKIARGRKQARVVAETLFAVFLATMLEFMMRESAPAKWLVDTLRARLLLLREGIA